eukprot:m.20530 g.20530  ORF g.20530 m.20530 type:complete len:544 (+) comp5258_c0_seq1:44-1675(+)
MEFFKAVQQLKKVKRGGWVRRLIPNVESVADHSYMMAMMMFAIPEGSTLNKEKCFKMCLVHDLAESIVGDITPFDGISKEEKSKREENAMGQICSRLSPICANNASEAYALWKDYDTCASMEAQFVKDIDKLEMILQADTYEQDYNMDLQEFFDSAQARLKTDLVKEWANELISNRSNRMELLQRKRKKLTELPLKLNIESHSSTSRRTASSPGTNSDTRYHELHTNTSVEMTSSSPSTQAHLDELLHSSNKQTSSSESDALHGSQIHSQQQGTMNTMASLMAPNGMLLGSHTTTTSSSSSSSSSRSNNDNNNRSDSMNGNVPTSSTASAVSMNSLPRVSTLASSSSIPASIIATSSSSTSTVGTTIAKQPAMLPSFPHTQHHHHQQHPLQHQQQHHQQHQQRQHQQQHQQQHQHLHHQKRKRKPNRAHCRCAYVHCHLTNDKMDPPNGYVCLRKEIRERVLREKGMWSTPVTEEQKAAWENVLKASKVVVCNKHVTGAGIQKKKSRRAYIIDDFKTFGPLDAGQNISTATIEVEESHSNDEQ